MAVTATDIALCGTPSAELRLCVSTDVDAWLTRLSADCEPGNADGVCVVESVVEVVGDAKCT